jgi:hypothetical protein
MEIYHGDILYSTAWDHLQVHTDSYIVVKDGFVDITADIFECNGDERSDILRVIFCLCTYSLYFKEAANLLIDTCFPVTDTKVEKKQKKEKQDKPEKGDKPQKAKKAEPENNTEDEA